MKTGFRKAIVWTLTMVMALSVFSIPAGALEKAPDEGKTVPIENETEKGDTVKDGRTEGEPAYGQEGEGQAGSSGDEEMLPELQAVGTISGSFSKEAGKDIASIRYYTDAEKTRYAFADFSYNSSAKTYDYSFEAPYEGFTAVQGTSKEDGSATVIAEYYSTAKWDGAVDVSWYDPNKKEYSINTPAQLAGLAAVVNGSINNTTPIYKVKGRRSDLTKTFDYDTPQTSLKQDKNEGLPDVIENRYEKQASLVAGVKDEAYIGLAKNDFSDKTVKITADLDMGGVPGSEIDHNRNFSGSTTEGGGANNYDYPNWTPIGGEYLMDPGDGSTMIIASFNGTLDGGGHDIRNVYCFRWSYRTVGETAYGYAQGTGLIGMMGSLYEGEENPEIMPAVRNMSLSGYFFGRRMVGGFVGCMGGGSNAASGSSVEGGIKMENLANHAYAYCTDSKGLGGIVACSMIDKGTIVNCYNDGNLETVYSNPTGGIIGANEGMSIYCCYNKGKLNTRGQHRGRAIGCDSGGRNYKVDDCYYLEGSGDDDEYPGYYTYNPAKSVSVNTVSMTEKEMSDGTLLNKLNVNGKAYVRGDGGYPVLYREKNSSPGTGSLSVSQQPEAGTISASKTGSIINGTVVYLSNKPETGWKCRYYKLNGSRLSGNYVTVNGSCEISGHYESAKPGILKVKPNDVCDIEVEKNGIIKENGEVRQVEHYPVAPGDSLYEGDFLMIKAELKEGKTPEDENLTYRALVKGMSGPFEYNFSYVDGDDEVIGEPKTTEVATYTVGQEIAGEEISLSLDVKPLTCKKMWDHVADKNWYNETDREFTLTSAEELAGLSVLVDEGESFEGKTIKLGKDISLKNNDGTKGKRYWDGIGDRQSDSPFAGVFDGGGHKITDFTGSTNGLFEYTGGSSAAKKAQIKDLELRGSSKGQDACGFVALAENTDISGCDSYCVVKGAEGDGHAAAIVGQAADNCSIEDCRNYAVVEGYGKVGGIAGELKRTCSITGCVNKGNVYSLNTGGNYVGGIAGRVSGEISKSTNCGNVNAYGRWIGGIAGHAGDKNVKIDSCSNTGEVSYENGTSSNDAVGGIIGFGARYRLSNSFNYGKVEKLNGSMPDSNIGAVIGKEGKNSRSSTDDVYYLAGSCEYAAAGQRQEELDPDASYSKGIKAASAADFADINKVFAYINDNEAFDNVKPGYPELKAAAGAHVHSGGTASCCILAVCDDCGLSYGLYSKEHGETKLVGAREAVWLTNGYSGDKCCKDCGRILEKGSVIAADENKKAVDIIVKKGRKTVAEKSYTVRQFDNMKVSGTNIGYSYGSKSDNIEAVTQYVTLDKLFEGQDLTAEDVESIRVICSSVSATVSMDTLKSCNKYYENGREYAAPATFAIAWNTGTGSLETVAKESKVKGSIRFGYGISKEQYDTNASIGGARLISPVNTVEINLSQSRVKYKKDDSEEAQEYTLSDALEAANNDGGSIVLFEDIDAGNDGFVIDAGENTVVLDLGNAGCELSGNATNCITVKSGTLEIIGAGTVKGMLAAEGSGRIVAKGGSYTYEVESEFCAEGYVPEYDRETKLYTMKSKSAYDAARSANALARLAETLNEQLEELKAWVKLLDITVNAKASALSYDSVKLSWSCDSTENVVYKVEKKTGGGWEVIETAENSFVDTAEPGIPNEYRISAGLQYKGAKEEYKYVYGKAAAVSVTTGLNKAYISKLTTKGRKLAAKWNTVPGAQGYEVWIGTDSAVTKGLVKYSNVKGLSVTSKRLKKGRKYYAKVRAYTVNSQGQKVYGVWSAAKAIKCK